MSLKSSPKFWAVLCVLLMVGAVGFWMQGEKVRRLEMQRRVLSDTNVPAASPSPANPADNRATPTAEPAAGDDDAAVTDDAATDAGGPAATLVEPDPGISPEERERRLAGEGESFPHRLRNNDRLIGELIHDDRALLLRNALIDTTSGRPLSVPEHLRAGANPGGYLVQANGPVDDSFRIHLAIAEAEIVSYIPNNAYLVATDAEGARVLSESPTVAAVVPYEPYFKVDPFLLNNEIKPEGRLSVVFFPGRRAAGEALIAQLDAAIVGYDRTPFGELAVVEPTRDIVAALARDTSVLAVEPYLPRSPANDLSRVVMKVATNTLAETENHLGLTGEGIIVGVNDTGVDVQHPALTGRVWVDVPSTGDDFDGHGTHVAGTIAGDGTGSPTEDLGVIGSEAEADFRGIAPAATIFAQPIDLVSGPLLSNQYLQENSARTNALISNNSWGYVGAFRYNFASASYDAAVRDSLPGETGPQGLSYVFAAGNSGAGRNNGQGGLADSVSAPANAKNVISVGAIENFRSLTNDIIVTNMIGGMEVVTTNQTFLLQTDSDDEIASFSSRGNTGIGDEGEFGRFKPDIVAPGTWVASLRSRFWQDPEEFENAFVNNVENQSLDPGESDTRTMFLPDDATRVRVILRNHVPADSTNSISVSAGPQGGGILVSDVNEIDYDLQDGDPRGAWTVLLENLSNLEVSFNLTLVYYTRSSRGNYFEELEKLNDILAPEYRFESGTSMAAPNVSGVMALMQEFFQEHLQETASPALMKAALINGARTINSIYGFAVRDNINYQGWGGINLTNSIPEAVAEAAQDAWPVRYIEQDDAMALATGQEHTWTITLSEEARTSPLRATLVWTDPPGNPAAALMLVNDLDLVITNLDSGAVFVGNDFFPEEDFVTSNENTTNDVVNNVENIFLNRPLGERYSVTVRANRVNVNAVTTRAEDILQDFALVISSDAKGGDNPPFAAFEEPVTPTDREDGSVDSIYIKDLNNSEPLLEEVVGANSPYLESINGDASQWNFYTFTNTVVLDDEDTDPNSLTNVAVVTFLALNESLPRLSQEGDLDLYVSTEPGLTNLNPGVIFSSWKSRRRGGNESVVIENATPGAVYYIGVKSEDQQAVQYGLIAASGPDQFAVCDDLGCTMRPIIPNGGFIPDGTPAEPGGLPVVFPGTAEAIDIRRVIYTNGIVHESWGDLLVNLSHDQEFAVPHNGSLPEDDLSPADTRYRVYDDTGEEDAVIPDPIETIDDGQIIPRRSVSDGPQSLVNFIGADGSGPWQNFIVDNSPNFVGRLEFVELRIDRMPPLDNFEVNLTDGSFYGVSTNIQAGATNLSVIILEKVTEGPVHVYIRRGVRPTLTDYDKFAILSEEDDSVSIGPRDIPPLSPPGLYHILFYDPIDGTDQRFRARVLVEYDLDNDGSVDYASGDVDPLIDDAVTNAVINVDAQRQVGGLDVGFRIDHDRAADLSIHLTSPSGTRLLLTENRGRTNEFGYGEGGPDTEKLENIYAESFDRVRRGTYVTGEQVGDWVVTRDDVTSLFAPEGAYTGSRLLSLNGGAISNTLPATNANTYELQFAYRGPGTDYRLKAAYPFDGSGADSVGPNAGFPEGNPTYSTGKVAQAFLPDGQNDYVRVRAAAELDIGASDGGFTIEGWVRPLDTDVEQPLVEWNDGAGNRGLHLWLGVNPTNAGPTLNGGVYANLVEDDGTPHPFASDVDVITNDWQHVALTYDRAGGVATLYVNGANVGQTNFGGFAVETSSDLYFAHSPDGPAFFEGGMDEFGFYDRALTACEIGAIFGADEEGRLAADLSGCAFPGTTQVLVEGNVVETLTSSADWQVARVRYLATVDDTPVEIDGNPNGVYIDALSHSLVIFDPPIVQTRFSENTNIALAPIKFADPPYASNILVVPLETTDFEAAVNGPGVYTDPDPVENSWTVHTNSVQVVADPELAYTNLHFLALADGTLSVTNFPINLGSQYEITVAYRDNGLIGWWTGDNAPLDVAEMNNGFYLNEQPDGYAAGLVNNAFAIDGVPDRRVTFADTDTFKFAGSFSIEAWVNLNAHPATGVAPIFARGDQTPRFSYYLAVTNGGNLVFHLDDGDTNQLHVTSAAPIPTGAWTHVAGVLDDIANQVVLYVDGVEAARADIGDARPLLTLDGTQSPEVAIGGHGAVGATSLDGLIDELSLYDRAITGVEVDAVFRAGADGKAGAGNEPQLEPSAYLVIDGLDTNELIGASVWDAQTFEVPANSGSVTFDIIGNPHGMLIDYLRISELRSFNHFLPEESLSAFEGELATGDWKLEVWDTRAGAAVDDRLIEWELSFVFANENPGCIELEHAQPVDVDIAPGAIQYFCVDVPFAASFATNTLASISGQPVDLVYSPSGIPNGTTADERLFLANALTGRVTIGTNSTEIIQDGGAPVDDGTTTLNNGQRYYLGVRNSGVGTVSINIGVEFDLIDGITRLTNGVRVVDGSIEPGVELDYYQIDVSTNATALAFQLLNPTDDVDLLVIRGPTLPATNRFDYSDGLGDAVITNRLVTFDTNTVPDLSGRWYAAAWNQGATNASYEMRVTEIYGEDPTLIDPDFIAITNLVSTEGLPSSQPAGVSLTNFFRFTIDGDEDAVLFEVYGLADDVDLVVRRDALPSIISYDYSGFEAGTTSEFILIRTNDTVPSLNGEWYLGVPNNAFVREDFFVRAAVPVDGILTSGEPPRLGDFEIVQVDDENLLRFTFNAVPGENYEIESTTDLNPVIVWTLVDTITAVGRTVTFTNPVPVTPPPPNKFFRVEQVP